MIIIAVVVGMKFSGKHLMLAIETDFDLENVLAVKTILCEAVKATGATILGTLEHKFTPQGYSAVVLIAESHASIHTYPECKPLQRAFIDYFTCGNIVPHKFAKYIFNNLKINKLNILSNKTIKR